MIFLNLKKVGIKIGKIIKEDDKKKPKNKDKEFIIPPCKKEVEKAAIKGGQGLMPDKTPNKKAFIFLLKISKFINEKFAKKIR